MIRTNKKMRSTGIAILSANTVTAIMHTKTIPKSKIATIATSHIGILTTFALPADDSFCAFVTSEEPLAPFAVNIDFASNLGM